MDQFYVEVGKLLLAARQKAGLTQEQLAKEVGLTRTSVTNMERGRQKILLHTLADIARVLKTSVGAMVPSPAAPSKLSDLVKGRSVKEQDWVIATVTSKDT